MNRILTTLKEKWPEYLIEAIVIIASIIGAFWLDEWNANLENEKLVANYYCRFLQDIEQDEVSIERLLQESADRLKACNLMMAELQKEVPEKKQVIKYLLQGTARITYQFFAISTGYNDLKSSGNLNVFTDDEIKDKLGNYYQEVEGIAGNINFNGKIGLQEVFELHNMYEIGFADNEFFKNGIDSLVVDKSKLNYKPLTSEQINQLLHVSSVLISLNDRSLSHYKIIQNKISSLKPELAKRCRL